MREENQERGRGIFHHPSDALLGTYLPRAEEDWLVE